MDFKDRSFTIPLFKYFVNIRILVDLKDRERFDHIYPKFPGTLMAY